MSAMEYRLKNCFWYSPDEPAIRELEHLLPVTTQVSLSIPQHETPTEIHSVTLTRHTAKSQRLAPQQCR